MEAPDATAAIDKRRLEAGRQPPGPQKFRRRSQARPQKIVTAASRLFDSLGLHRVTLEMVAHQAGLSRGGLNRHFPTKAALLRAVEATKALRAQ